MKILVTGMSGLIGGATRKRLSSRHELTAFNRSMVGGVKTVQGDLIEFDKLLAACEGQDVVIHLAAKAGENYTWQELQDTNVIGTRNVFDAARLAGVKKVIYASSGATVAGWESEEPYAAMVQGRYDDVPDSWQLIDHEMAVRPRGIYGATKVWGEALARHYADTTDMSFLCLRIGFVNKEDRPVNPRQRSVWCSQRDITNMIELCVNEEAQVSFDTFFVNSNNRWGYRDLSHAEQVVGFVPMDSAEDQFNR